MKPYRRLAVLAIAVLLAACGTTSRPGTSAAPSPTPTRAPSATPAAPSATPSESPPALVGEWRREQRCEEIVAALTKEGFAEAWVLDYASSFVPGATGADDIAEPEHPCVGAVPLMHSHFFTAGGRFGSRDQNREQVDEGTYRIVDDRTFVISNTLGSDTLKEVTFHFAVDGDTITFEPVIPDCRPDCFEAVWSVTVAFPGLTWTRVA